MIWHSSEISEIQKELKFNSQNGLAADEVQARIKEYGENRMSFDDKSLFLVDFVNRFFKPINIALIVLALVLAVTGAIVGNKLWFASVFVFLIIGANSALFVFWRHKSNIAVSLTKSKVSTSAKVLRDGKVCVVDSATLVPGDIIYFEQGDYIPADGRLLEENSLICEESALSGDSSPCEKQTDIHLDDICPREQRKNMVYSGGSVIFGKGTAVVTDTGINTEAGKMATIAIQTEGADTPSKKYLKDLGAKLNIAIAVAAAIIALLGVIFISPGQTHFSDFVLNLLFIGVSALAVGINELLPETVYATLSAGVKRLDSQNILLRNLSSSEELSKISVIISDKTGTLTKNQMYLTSVFNGVKTIYPDTDDMSENDISIIRTGALCCNGNAFYNSAGKRQISGDPTEAGIVDACLKYCNLSKDELENIYPRMGDIPFDSSRKLMTTVNMINNRPLAIVKGSPDILMSLCTSGNIKAAQEAAEQMAANGQRVIAVAIKPFDEVPANLVAEEVEQNLSLLGLFGLVDTLSDATKRALNSANNAQIKTVMVTGDHKTTAAAVAKELGILNDGDEIITGEELDKLSDAEFADAIGNITVYSRITAENKVRIIKAWQNAGHSVLITGDSASDAEVLRTADIGAAMGITGTDVAKGSADVILKDDSYISAVKSVAQGRNFIGNVRRSAGFILSAVLSELLVLLFGIFIFKNTVLGALSLCFINLLGISALGVGICFEPAGSKIMNTKFTVYQNQFKNTVNYLFFAQSIIMSVLTLVSYGIFGVTGAFATFLLTLVAAAFSARSDSVVFFENILNNKTLLAVMGIVILLCILITVKPLCGLFGVTVLSAAVFFSSFGFAIADLVILEILKFALNFLGKNKGNK